VRVHSRRKRAGVSSIAPIDADAPNVVWAIDFQFDSAVDGKAIKIASMIDEHTRESLLNIVERSITAERLVTELEKRSTRQVGRRRCCGWTTGQNWFRKRCNASARTSPAWSMSRRAVGQRLHQSFNNGLRKECLNRNHWTTLFEARVVVGDFKHEHNHRHRHSALGYRTPAEYAPACRHLHTPAACEIN
jgi:putative transposase